jgi:methyl-accepting chemotaxis protein
MELAEPAPELIQRLRNYRLDDRARAILRDMRPIISPLIGPAIDGVIEGGLKLPHVADLWRRYGAEMRRIEQAQFDTLLLAEFDHRYLAASRSTIEREFALGFEIRARVNCAAAIIHAAAQKLRRQTAFSRRPERLDVLSQAILFDLATTYTDYLQMVDEASAKRRRDIDDAIGEFNGTIGAVTATIKEISTSLSATSAAMQRIADDTLRRLTSASLSSINIAAGVDQTVAATGELANSIRSIGEETARGLQMSQTAVANSEQTEQTVRELNDAADKIGSVVALISKIASQTNLLALNATIEAARAGDTGRGFAVVASEVKTLANQTTRATEDISRNIVAIQQKTGLAVREIAAVANSIHELTTAATSIASAVEEQEAATRSISGSIKLVAGNSSHAADEMRSIEQSAGQSVATADEITQWTARLNDGAHDLEMKVSDFFARVRSA